MSSDTLPNYIRSARKSTGLTAKDLARLLGNSSGSCISKYEVFKRVPTLKRALLLHIVLDKPIDTLFAGIYQEAEEAVSQRANELFESVSLARKPSSQQNARLQWLRQLANDGQETLPL